MKTTDSIPEPSAPPLKPNDRVTLRKNRRDTRRAMARQSEQHAVRLHDFGSRSLGKVTVHITPSTDEMALPVAAWVSAAHSLIDNIRAIEPQAIVRIDTTGLGRMHHHALRAAGVTVGRFVQVLDYAPVLALIPKGQLPCRPNDLPPRPAVLSDFD